MLTFTLQGCNIYLVKLEKIEAFQVETCDKNYFEVTICGGMNDGKEQSGR